MADTDALGPGVVAVGAPGRYFGWGAIDTIRARDRRTLTTVTAPARALGTRMTTTGDSDGDGYPDLLVAVEVDGIAHTVPLLGLR